MYHEPARDLFIDSWRIWNTFEGNDLKSCLIQAKYGIICRWFGCWHALTPLVIGKNHWQLLIESALHSYVNIPYAKENDGDILWSALYIVSLERINEFSHVSISTPQKPPSDLNFWSNFEAPDGVCFVHYWWSHKCVYCLTMCILAVIYPTLL